MSDDGKRVAFLTGKGGVNIVHHDDRILAEHDLREESPSWPLSFSGDGAVVAWRVRDERKKHAFVVVGERKGPPFHAVGRPILNRDGSVVAYWTQEKEGLDWFVRVNEKSFGPYDFVDEPVLSGDGRIVAFLAGAVDEDVAVVNGEERTAPKHAGQIFLNGDGSKVGYVIVTAEGKKRRFRTWVDGVEGEVFDYIGMPSFSPDGKSVAYEAKRDGAEFVVVGAHRFPAEGIQTAPIFDASGSNVGYGARLGNELWWKVIPVPK